MTAVEFFNAFEVGLWLLLAAIAVVLGIRKQQRPRRIILFLFAIGLVLFAASDAVEFHTGAWWRPWWLLCWKGFCLLAFLGLAAAYVGGGRKARTLNVRGWVL